MSADQSLTEQEAARYARLYGARLYYDSNLARYLVHVGALGWWLTTPDDNVYFSAPTLAVLCHSINRCKRTGWDWIRFEVRALECVREIEVADG